MELMLGKARVFHWGMTLLQMRRWNFEGITKFLLQYKYSISKLFSCENPVAPHMFIKRTNENITH
jgi:hypothetical protein